MKKADVFRFVTGLLAGAVMSGGAAAYAAGVTALPGTAEIVIDGQTVNLKGYVIEGNHYFKLRDLDAALVPGGKDFGIVWDSQENRVIINTSRGYEANGRYAPPSAPPAAAVEPAMTVDGMKAEIVRLTNIERVKAGVPELEVLPGLTDCAQAKAQDFLDNQYYGHNSPVYGEPLEMVLSSGINASGCSENIVPGRTTAEKAMAAWMASESHRKNILNTQRTHIGVGIIPTADGKAYMWVMQLITLEQER